MIKIAHESPKSIFETVQKYTDYDYALVHLFEEDEEYLLQFKEAIKKGREVILDNSIFELEEAFDANKSLGYKGSGKIGVVQGKTYDEIVDCYNYMNKEADVDMIAISFDYSYYTDSVPHPNKYVSWMLGRVKLLGDLLKDGVINIEKPHHLLGCGLPQEFAFYAHYPWIYSLDTSNPVVHGIKGIKYGSDGLWSKESQKLFELINYDVEDINLILSNIQKFRWFTNGKREVQNRRYCKV
jgi:hypothetical protein